MTPRFSQYVLLRARPMLAGLVCVVLGLIALSVSPLTDRDAGRARGAGDVALYRAEIERMRSGESYYDAAAAELRPRGYPTRSVFNWRTPLPMWLIAKLPTGAGKALLGALALALLVAAYEVTYREASGARAALMAVGLLTGALLPCVLGDLYVMPVVWAGVLIALSLSAFALDRSRWGVALGLAALFARELAGPYCALMFVLAIRRRKREEATMWLLGLIAYAAFFAWHVAHVHGQMRPDDIAHEAGWLRFGGAAFLLAVAQMNCYLLLLPLWATAIYLPLAMIGFATWSSPAGHRAAATVVAYLALFAAVGQPFNQYWGSLLAPTLCFGAARGWPAIVGLVRAAWTGVAPQPASSATACGA